MKITIKNILLLVTACYIIQTNINCAAGVVAAIFIPLLGATPWVNAADADDKFFFLDVPDNSNTSMFTGNEILHSDDMNTPDTTLHFTGSFTNHDIQFIYDADALLKPRKNYKGTVNDASTQIELTSPDGLPALTLKKQ